MRRKKSAIFARVIMLSMLAAQSPSSAHAGGAIPCGIGAAVGALVFSGFVTYPGLRSLAAGGSVGCAAGFGINSAFSSDPKENELKVKPTDSIPGSTSPESSRRPKPSSGDRSLME